MDSLLDMCQEDTRKHEDNAHTLVSWEISTCVMLFHYCLQISSISPCFTNTHKCQNIKAEKCQLKLLAWFHKVSWWVLKIFISEYKENRSNEWVLLCWWRLNKWQWCHTLCPFTSASFLVFPITESENHLTWSAPWK